MIKKKIFQLQSQNILFNNPFIDTSDERNNAKTSNKKHSNVHHHIGVAQKNRTQKEINIQRTHEMNESSNDRTNKMRKETVLSIFIVHNILTIVLHESVNRIIKR